MAKRNDGGPAFARPVGNNGATDYEDREANYEQEGMSLRDYFAGQALAGLCANGESVIIDGERTPIQAAAYRLADAMLAERAKAEGR